MVGFGTAILVNCTFVNNYANNGGSVWFGGAGVIRNCVFWNNRDDYGVGAGIGVAQYPHRFPDVSHSILQNETQYYPGIGVFDLDPKFVDADGADDIPGTEDDDLRLRPGSPAIKAGDRLAPEEIAALLEQRHLVADAHHCPHGRPAALVFTREELDKQFKRM
jgi:hypothetical protein